MSIEKVQSTFVRIGLCMLPTGNLMPDEDGGISLVGKVRRSRDESSKSLGMK